MAKKTFKIGEYAKGGIIVAEVTKNNLLILECRDWYTKKLLYLVQVINREQAIDTLYDWTSSYYADNIMEWAESKGARL